MQCEISEIFFFFSHPQPYSKWKRWSLENCRVLEVSASAVRHRAQSMVLSPCCRFAACLEAESQGCILALAQRRSFPLGAGQDHAHT